MLTRSIILALIVTAIAAGCESEGLSDSGQTGQGGSMSRFAINGPHLYVATNSTIQVFDIGANNFQKLGQVTVGFGLETIFARGQYLYLGANDAMYIYSIANPATPEFIFRYAHIVACDPVVVQGNRAYVTLRSSMGANCNRGVNALEIIDITDPYDPTLLANYQMVSPHGLGVYGNYLFLCEGESGLKVFDITDESDIELLKHVTDIHAYDVIVRPGIATVTGDDGIFQFSYPDGASVIRLLSKIDVQRQQL
ncbi:MAG TPA: hypothetical protein VEB86_03105 [Chryseosolibacter sp.]|nr:hypothetical protein [Chryseosolibacter sp.]